MGINTEEVNIDPRAPRSVRLDWFDSASSRRPSIRPPADQHNSSPSNKSPPKPPPFWIFRATLSDGSQFAIDPCNAQYSFTTRKDRSRGVFPWDSYLGRLMVPDDGPFNTYGLTHRRPNARTPPTGTLKEGRANFFRDEDIRSTAECAASAQLDVTARTLVLSHDLQLTDIMARSSNGQVFAEYVEIYKEKLDRTLRMTRDKGLKNILMARFEVKEGRRQLITLGLL